MILVGKVVKVWSSPNSDRLKIGVVKWVDADCEQKVNENILLIAGKKHYAYAKLGDIVQVKVRLEFIPAKKDSKEFPERMYWAGEGIRKKGWVKSIQVISSDKDSFRILSYAGDIQDKLCGLIDNSLVGADQGAILKAMILGQKDELPSEVKDVFRATGISHLLAVSGLHVGLVYLVIIRLLFFLKHKRARQIAEFIAIIAVWAYSFMTGFGPSVQRAAGMISLFALSRLMNRNVKPFQILALSFLIQTALNPFAFFSFGFQLSYLAVGGIFLVYPYWQGILKTSKPAVKKVWDFSGISISAQTFTFPFILIYFQEFPSYFLFGNLILVPIGLIVFYLGVIYIPILALGVSFNLPAWLLDQIIGVMLFLGKTIAGLPFAVIKFNSFSIFHLIFYFLVAGILFSTTKVNTYKKLVLIVLCLLVLSCMAIFQLI